MAKFVLNATVFIAETLAHASVIIDGAESASPLIVGAGLVGFCMACAAIMPQMRATLVIDGPAQID